MRGDGMVDMTDGLCMAVRPEARHLVEGKVGAGRDDQIVVVDEGAVIEFDPVFLRMHLFRAFGTQGDTAPPEGVRQIDGDVVALPPADGHPGIGRYKGIGRAKRHHAQLVFAA